MKKKKQYRFYNNLLIQFTWWALLFIILEMYFLNGNYTMKQPYLLAYLVFFAWLPFYFTPILCQTTSGMSRSLLPVSTGEGRKLGCLKANKPMLPPCTAVSEAIPGQQISYIQLLRYISVSYLTKGSKSILFETCLKQ